LKPEDSAAKLFKSLGKADGENMTKEEFKAWLDQYRAVYGRGPVPDEIFFKKYARFDP
jgi:hypothetical protein